MSSPASPQGQGSSTRPYLIRALHEWCTDNGFTPYIAVHVNGGVQVPKEYVKNNEIVLNVGFEATTGLKLGNEFIEFKARFGGVARDIVAGVPSIIMRPELYVTAAALAAVLTVVGALAGMPDAITWAIAWAAGFSLRAAAIRFRLALPAYREGSEP